MRTFLRTVSICLMAAGALSAPAQADDWTGPKDVARSAHEFAGATRKLQDAIKEAVADSPLVEEAGRLSKSVAQFEAAVQKGATYAVAEKDFRKIEADHAHFEAGLKKAHDVHHEESVQGPLKKAKAAFEQLQAHMSGRRPAEKADQASPRSNRENNG